MTDLTDVAPDDIVTSARQNLINDYIQDGTHKVNTLSLDIGSVETIDSSRNVKCISTTPSIDTMTYGFVNRTSTTLSFDGTDTLTLTDASGGSGWSYYRAGIKYTISGNKTSVISSPVDGTLYYFYIDATNGTISNSVNGWTLNDTKVPVAIVYWDSTLTTKYILEEERHTCDLQRANHRYEHYSEGTKFISGPLPTGLTAGSDTDSDKTFGMASETQIADENIFLNLTTLSDPDGATPTYYIFYRTSTTAWKYEISDMPFKYTTSAGPVYGYIEYDNGSGSSTQAGANNFVNTYIFVNNAVANTEADSTKSTSAFRYAIVQGRGAYSSAALARAESFGDFSMTGFPLIEGVAIYQLTWATTNRPNSVKGRCRYVSTQRITSNIISTTIQATGSHNTLSGLEGGTTNEYYHLTNDEYTGTGIGTGNMARLSGATLTSPIIATDITIPNSGLHVLDTNASHDLVITPGSDLSADRILTLTTGDAARTITLTGDLAMSGAYNLTLTTSNTTNVTLPTTGTLATLAGTEALSGKTLTDPIINLDANGIFQDLTPTTDATGSGLKVTLMAGENLAAGDVGYYKSDGKVWKTDSDAEATTKGMVVLATATITTGNTGTFIKRGNFRLDSWAWTTADVLYLSGTPGTLTATAPSASGKFVRVAAYALDGDNIMFDPDNTYIELV